LDPWWNPAAESQAIDRAHRIGQKNKVFAYKIIAKDTVEEKILALQEKKRALAKALFAGGAGMMKGLRIEDLRELFG
jgi:SNF2 family DNA or RNA helicase